MRDACPVAARPRRQAARGDVAGGLVEQGLVYA
eukprot:CAMPEP_0171101828 /NCGR_PEP_ID=MMETSP0766_2-20121228/56098_1 /TAXON_ID=439317 /ORGANISM="Gambierdiscus australes, Strain CAWD 149" /LENGTH=32 /DNA_ID= /DNA_START= /DNA_END= /DNA_ORIENTATION=